MAIPQAFHVRTSIVIQISSQLVTCPYATIVQRSRTGLKAVLVLIAAPVWTVCQVIKRLRAYVTQCGRETTVTTALVVCIGQHHAMLMVLAPHYGILQTTSA